MADNIHFNSSLKFYQIIRIILSTVATLSGTSPVRNGGQSGTPCNHEVVIATNSSSNLMKQIAGLNYSVVAVARLTNKVHETTTSMLFYGMEGYNFLPNEEFSISGGNFSIGSINTIRSNYLYFYEQILKLRTYIKKAASLIPTIENITQDLNDISEEIERLLCKLYILYGQSFGSTSNLTTSYESVPEFSEGNLTDIEKVFVIISDCMSLMNSFQKWLNIHSKSVKQIDRVESF